MRGKKSDPTFVAEFITESIQQGIETPDDIVKNAKKKLEQIDNEIRAIEGKKILRSKLLDVILTFEKQAKNVSEDAKLLSFFDLQYQTECKRICDLIQEASVIETNKSTLTATDRFCIKQLLERKIIARNNDSLIKGERFEEYMTFVLREDKCSY
jgi:hypothetical protein